MAIAHAKNSGQDALELPPLRMLFFEERAASFFEMAVDHILGFDLITERERTLVIVFYVDDVELREESSRARAKNGGDEVPTARQ